MMFINKETLDKLYRKELKTDEEIGKMFSVTGNAVMYWRRKYGIKTFKQREKIGLKAKKTGLRNIESISKEEFETIYQEMGKVKMSRLFGCSKRLIKSKLDEFGIVAMDKTDRIINRCPSVFSQEQEDVIYGSLLGDGNVTKIGKNSRFKETHCIDQKQYLEWKHDVLSPFSKEITEGDIEMPSGYISRCFTFRSCFHPLFNQFREKFYTIDGKILPTDFEEKLNGLVLAIWYMDDGHLDGFDKKGYVTIASSFKSDEINRIVNHLNTLGLDVTNNFYENRAKGINIIRIHNTDKFFEMTKKHIVDCMLYKVPERLGGKKKEILNPQDVDEWFKHLKTYGFIYPVLNSELVKAEITGLINSKVKIENDEIICDSSSGSKLCKSLFHNFYISKRKGKKTPIEAFSDDDNLRHSLEECLRYNGKITESLIRTNICNQGGVNNFKPVLAKYIYDTWCPADGSVLDPCSGWGGRLSGFMASTAKSYTGIDVEQESVKNLKTLYSKMEPFFEGKVFKNYKSDFTEFETEEKFDLVFTSPPYFDAEIYGTDPDQSCIKFWTYDRWRGGFLKVLIEKSWNMLKTNGRIILNVPCQSKYPIYEDVKTFMHVEKEMKIRMNGRYGQGKRFEWLLISEKKV